ncbi:MAG: TetR family transcriptional regulator [Deltaproteobacteria bacterium]|nr:TetR family transcriptional regulator [Deltaproteobacteria bacterium]MBW2389166.1 TetR family transcriptional regulator [Deltaproteobacteria bacterium]MBW2725842.1 TetR family transcriptional regulator [Deltaproteobacteria bacterium]
MPPKPRSSPRERTPVPSVPSDESPPSRASTRTARRRESLETQEKILNAAETLFLETGFAATSLRAIARRAGVNLAAAHYHFGSKEGLLRATFHRRMAPLNATRILELEALEARSEPLQVREIMEAFLQPLSSEDRHSARSRLVGRLYGEPLSVSKPLIDDEFGEVSQRFLAALSNALPEVSFDVLRWRFHFVIGSMVHLFSFDDPHVPLEPDADLGDGLEHLIDFAVSGLDPEHANERGSAARVSAAFSASRIAIDGESTR